jgi:poly(3-hydroxybutyrate) depolymerase
MRSRTLTKIAGVLAGVVLSLPFALPQVQFAAWQEPAPAPAGQAVAPGARAGGRGAVDPRVQQRTYKFTATDDLPYALFVSSKVTRDKKNPLIVALHGLGGTQNTMMTTNAIRLAEEGGYILVAPMGYNSSGWYGAPATMAAGGIGATTGGFGGGGRGGAPRGAGAGAGRGAGPAGGPAPGAAAGAGRGASAAPATLGTPNETSQNSEKDVLNVLEIIRKEFNVDERRTYIMGHSMGGAGAMYLGVKHASNWAGIGAMAPATAPAGINPNNYKLDPAKDVPFIIVQGDMDTLVPVAGARLWIDKMKELNITHQYVEVAGGDHGSVLTTGMADIFAFFNKHSKAAGK